MAIFLPALHSKNLKLNAGERRFGICAMRNLEDDYHCWVNVPIGPRQFRPDFVILHPGRGVLVLEIKSWNLETIKEVDRMTFKLLTNQGLKTVANPLEQGRTYAIAIKELLERDPLLVQQEEGRYHGHLLLPWGFGVVLTHITRKQFQAAGLENVIPEDRVICKDEMDEATDPESFQSRLWGMFQYNFGGVLSLARIDRVRWHLFPEIRIQQGNLFEAESPDTTGSVAKVLPDVVRIMDMEQEKIARNLGEGHRIVHGVAGSGKTLLLAYRCMHLEKMGVAKPILVLCFNKSLAARLKELLHSRGAGDKVHIRHFHGWCSDMCKLYQLDLPQNDDKLFERQVQAVITGTEQGRVPRAQYAAILIDEGHDFEPEWFKLLVQMIDPETNSLLLLYDDVQNIYRKQKKKVSWASLGISATGRSTILKVNYRNTVEALDFAYRFLRSYMTESETTEDIPVVAPEFGGRSGPKPEVHRAACKNTEAEYLAGWFKKRASEGVPFKDMAVLCRYKQHQMDFIRGALTKHGIPVMATEGESKDAVQLLTLHASKGLEFNSVAIIDLGCMPNAQTSVEEEARLLYVGMTRSTEQLLLTHHSDSLFTKQFQALGTQKEKPKQQERRIG